MKVGKYAKTVIAVVIGGAYAAQAAIVDGVVTNTEWIGIVMAGLIAAGVWAVPNQPEPTRAVPPSL